MTLEVRRRESEGKSLKGIEGAGRRERREEQRKGREMKEN